MYKSFFVEMITPERTFFKGDIECLNVVTEEGELGVLAGHLPMVAALKSGTIRFLQNGKWKEAANSEGFIEIRPDETVVLTQTMEWPEEIELNRVREAIERAEEVMRQNKSLREYQLGKASLAKAFARLRVRSHYFDDRE